MNWFIPLALAVFVGFLIGRLTAGRDTSRTPQMPTVPVPGPWDTFSAGTTEVAPPAGAFHVWLAEPGPNAIATIKAIRTVTRLGLKEAKDFHDRAPGLLLRAATQTEVDRAQRAFANVAHLEVRSAVPPQAPALSPTPSDEPFPPVSGTASF